MPAANCPGTQAPASALYCAIPCGDANSIPYPLLIKGCTSVAVQGERGLSTAGYHWPAAAVLPRISSTNSEAVQSTVSDTFECNNTDVYVIMHLYTHISKYKRKKNVETQQKSNLSEPATNGHYSVLLSVLQCTPVQSLPPSLLPSAHPMSPLYP